ncbi:MAG: prepilin-type N-terminal cleavage/methylation domain-containing protein [Candidatus Omnitrophica bacterium]|nr:prepilin-type N-terminal cleavage/methylation domain-containing protein [Candidatus Omnitrophota bacterium]
MRTMKGLTLVEVLVATAIGVVIMGIMITTYLSSTDLYESQNTLIDLQSRARNAIIFMTTELKNATRTSAANPSPNLSIPSTPNNKDIQFYVPEDKNGDGLITDSNGLIEWDTDNKIQYQYVPGLEELRRLEKGNQYKIAQNVSDIRFIDASVDSSLAINEVRIILTLSAISPRRRLFTVTQTGIVRLRN